MQRLGNRDSPKDTGGFLYTRTVGLMPFPSVWVVIDRPGNIGPPAVQISVLGSVDKA
jgi:hypothetical protein